MERNENGHFSPVPMHFLCYGSLKNDTNYNEIPNLPKNEGIGHQNTAILGIYGVKFMELTGLVSNVERNWNGTSSIMKNLELERNEFHFRPHWNGTERVPKEMERSA